MSQTCGNCKHYIGNLEKCKFTRQKDKPPHNLHSSCIIKPSYFLCNLCHNTGKVMEMVCYGDMPTELWSSCPNGCE